MSTIVKTKLRQPLPFLDELEHRQDAVRIPRASVRRGEEIRRLLPFPFLQVFQDGNDVIPDCNRAICVLGLEKAFLDAALHADHLTADRQRLLRIVYVPPLQSKQFVSAKPGSKFTSINFIFIS